MDDVIKTLSWVETTMHRRLGGMGESVRETRVWLRADPPAIAHIGSEAGEHQVIDGNGIQTTNDTWDCVMVRDQPRSFSGNWIYGEALAPDGVYVTTNAQWDISEFQDDGKTLTRLERRYIHQNFEFEEVIIAKNSWIIRRSERNYELAEHTIVYEKIQDKYAYNETPPEGTFDMPSSKPKRRHTKRSVAESYPPVTDESVKASVQSIIQSCDAAWKSGDWAAFASLWQFSAVGRPPGEDDWRRRFERHAGKWSKWESGIGRMNYSNAIASPMTASGFTLTMVSERLVCVHVGLEVERAAGGHWEGHADYYLQAFDDGYRIVHANIPLDEIEIICAQTTGE